MTTISWCMSVLYLFLIVINLAMGWEQSLIGPIFTCAVFAFAGIAFGRMDKQTAEEESEAEAASNLAVRMTNISLGLAPGGPALAQDEPNEPEEADAEEGPDPIPSLSFQDMLAAIPGVGAFDGAAAGHASPSPASNDEDESPQISHPTSSRMRTLPTAGWPSPRMPDEEPDEEPEKEKPTDRWGRLQ